MGIFKQTILNDKEEQKPYLCYMAASMCIGIRTYTRIQSYFESPKDFCIAGADKLERTGIFSKKQLKRLSECRKVISPLREYEKLLASGTEMVSCDEEAYPERLKCIRDMPPFLFYKGMIPPERIPAASIVGARECTPYGSNVAKKLGELFAEYNVSVISGMARGIDSISQAAALEAGGYSCAFLGGGPDIVYPPQSEVLYRALLKNGGVISEFPPGTAPLPQYFAMRNRLIAGMSDVVCVIEAKEKSGTLITVDCALDQGREVYAVPGRVTDITSYGTNELIRQGAGVIADPEKFVGEFVSHYILSKKETKNTFPEGEERNVELTEREKRVLHFCDDDSFIVDEMANRMGIPANDVLSACILLCSKKYLINIGAGRFVISGDGIRAKGACMSLS